MTTPQPKYALKAKSGLVGRFSLETRLRAYLAPVSAFFAEEAFAALSFLAEDFFAFFVVFVAAGFSVEPLDAGACAIARLAPSIKVTTNISSFFMLSPSEI
jgi:hypothetical protein